MLILVHLGWRQATGKGTPAQVSLTNAWQLPLDWAAWAKAHPTNLLGRKVDVTTGKGLNSPGQAAYFRMAMK